MTGLDVETVAVAVLPPTYTGQEAQYRDETDCARAVAVWVTKHGAVWVDDDGEINSKSTYSGACVASWHGGAIVSALRWRETRMPVERGETITAERAAHVPDGTVLALVGDDGRCAHGTTVIAKNAGFDACGARWRVLDLAPAERQRRNEELRASMPPDLSHGHCCGDAS